MTNGVGREAWRRLRALAMVPMCMLLGCSDPILGTWEQDKNTTGCGRIDFSLSAGSSGSNGEGIAPIANGNMCVNCQFSVVARNKGDSDWNLTLDFEVCAFDINGLITKRLELECVLEDSDDVLSCSSPLGSLSFDKVQ